MANNYAYTLRVLQKFRNFQAYLLFLTFLGSLLTAMFWIIFAPLLPNLIYNHTNIIIENLSKEQAVDLFYKYTWPIIFLPLLVNLYPIFAKIDKDTIPHIYEL